MELKRGLNDRRGLSDVVTTGLIILLAIAAVVIVWTFVKPAIETVGEEISIDCVRTSLEIVGCSESADTVTVKVGPGNTDIDAIKLAVYSGDDGTGPSTVSEGTDTICSSLNENDINPLEQVICAVSVASTNSVDVAAVIDGRTCPLTGKPVNC